MPISCSPYEWSHTRTISLVHIPSVRLYQGICNFSDAEVRNTVQRGEGPTIRNISFEKDFTDRRNMMMSPLVGVMDLVAALPARCFSTSPWTCGLPVRNIRAPREFLRIWLSESRSLTRCPGGHSSRASMHINVRREDEISCRNSTISESASLWPPMTFFWSRKVWTILSGTSSSPPTTCFSTEPRIVAGDCSS